jgi:hypothetical protein
MTAKQAEAIGDAIREIESGRVEVGVFKLRNVIRNANHVPPPPKLIEARQPKGMDR